MGLETLGARTLVSLVFGPAILISAWIGGYAFLGLVTLMVMLAMHEFYSLAVHKNARPQKILGIATGASLCLLLYFNQLQHLWILLSASFLVILIIELFRNKDSAILNVAATLLGIYFVALTLGFLLLIREVPNPISYKLGGSLVILIFATVWVCDSAAYMLGSKFGKHKLFERVSPNKTVEGTAFGFLFALLTAYICQLTFLPEISLVDALAIGVICGSFGQASDLIESLFKRDAGVKDASNLIPGHGGVLDRFDSEILVAPVVYFYLRFVVF